MLLVCYSCLCMLSVVYFVCLATMRMLATLLKLFPQIFRGFSSACLCGNEFMEMFFFRLTSHENYGN